jgi:hypothetical protein
MTDRHVHSTHHTSHVDDICSQEQKLDLSSVTIEVERAETIQTEIEVKKWHISIPTQKI